MVDVAWFGEGLVLVLTRFTLNVCAGIRVFILLPVWPPTLGTPPPPLISHCSEHQSVLGDSGLWHRSDDTPDVHVPGWFVTRRTALVAVPVAAVALLEVPSAALARVVPQLYRTQRRAPRVRANRSVLHLSAVAVPSRLTLEVHDQLAVGLDGPHRAHHAVLHRPPTVSGLLHARLHAHLVPRPNQNDRVGNIRERPPIRTTALGISVNDHQLERPRWEYPDTNRDS
eukprot:1195838-Prorocentrum_minimum.AAC.1